MIKFRTLALMAGASMLAVPAMAADLPIEPAPMEPSFIPAAPVFTWTGFYLGVNAGYAWGDADLSNAVLVTAPGGFFDRVSGLGPDGDGVFVSNPSFDADGWIAGGQVGYNVQLNQFVVGIEADLQYSDVEDSLVISGAPGGAANGFDTRVAASLDYFGTVRARAGFALDRFMIYATGGLAYGRVEIDRDYFDNFTGTATFASDKNTHIGYTVGGGLEGAITDNLTAKIEYLYLDLGEETYNTAYPGATASLEADLTAHIVRAGLNYKFSW